MSGWREEKEERDALRVPVGVLLKGYVEMRDVLDYVVLEFGAKVASCFSAVSGERSGVCAF